MNIAIKNFRQRLTADEYRSLQRRGSISNNLRLICDRRAPNQLPENTSCVAIQGVNRWDSANVCNGSSSSSNLLHTELEPPSQKESQRPTVRVPDLCGNLIDTCLAGLQEMHCSFNTQTLEI